MFDQTIPGHAVKPQDDLQRISEEIAYMEARLDEIGHDGDCAYEKAIIRFFREQLEVRRARLRAGNMRAC